jgi:hypothetical protein
MLYVVVDDGETMEKRNINTYVKLTNIPQKIVSAFYVCFYEN